MWYFSAVALEFGFYEDLMKTLSLDSDPVVDSNPVDSNPIVDQEEFHLRGLKICRQFLGLPKILLDRTRFDSPGKQA